MEAASRKLTFDYAPFRIEAGKVKEFALALGIEDSIYFDREYARKQGYEEIPVPPTFFTVIDYWNDRNLYQMFDDLGLDQQNVLHGEQSYEYLEDVFVGDTIYPQVSLVNHFQKSGKTFYFLRTVYKNQHSIAVTIGHSTLILVLGASS